MEYLKHKAILSPLHYTLNETVTLASKMDCQKNVAVMRYMKNGDLMNFVIKYGQIDSKVVVRLVRSIC